MSSSCGSGRPLGLDGLPGTHYPRQKDKLVACGRGTGEVCRRKKDTGVESPEMEITTKSSPAPNGSGTSPEAYAAGVS